jgi:hypothetical protein
VSKTPAQRLLDELIREYLVPAARAAGFKKDGRTFRYSLAESVRVVNVQTSQSNSADALRFTINLGVYFPRAQEQLKDLLRLEVSTARPLEYQCQVRQRLGNLVAGRDVWWDLRTPADVPRIGEEVRGGLVDAGLPWLTRMASWTAARTLLERNAPVTALGFVLEDGDLVTARKLLRSLLDSRPDTTELRLWGAVRGLCD